MSEFEAIHADRITGSLTMYDRLIFKGHLSRLFPEGSIRAYLWSQGVLVKDFTPYAKETTALIAEHCRALATDVGAPVIYLGKVRSWGGATQRKEDMARKIAEQDGVTEGVVCLISAVESCISVMVRKRHETHQLEVFRRQRACLHHYLYLIDPEFGFMHVRIQGWMPYEIQVYINGREWLARQLDKAKVGYLRHENSLQRIDNLERASELCETFAHRAWPRVLNAFAHMVNPLLGRITHAGFGGYRWCVDQAEIATDVMFTSRTELLRVWPDILRHATLNLGSDDVLGFLGRKLSPSLAAEVCTDAKRRPEGWRVRHRVGRNWVKCYDKGSVLRVETVINKPSEFRAPRVFTDPKGRRELRWLPMRKGVADFWRNFQVGIAANRRYLDALAAAPLKGEGVAALDALCRPRTKNGRTIARFNPLTPADLALFRAVLAGQNNINGFRNSDITRQLYPRPPANLDEAHRRCERVSRLIVKLRGHGLVAKVPRARLYRVTPYGQRVLAAAVAIHDEGFADRYLAAA
ncbi:MAG TPA: hypothetical protein VE990_00400 [Acidimicrobiales bacterium]|nr:hypothetical protein [Acidimicrobiales bacterium]